MNVDAIAIYYTPFQSQALPMGSHMHAMYTRSPNVYGIDGRVSVAVPIVDACICSTTILAQESSTPVGPIDIVFYIHR